MTSESKMLGITENYYGQDTVLPNMHHYYPYRAPHSSLTQYVKIIIEYLITLSSVIQFVDIYCLYMFQSAVTYVL
jgi:hypothetical protein